MSESVRRSDVSFQALSASMWSGFGFLAMGPGDLEARQTLTTLEAVSPDRGWRSCERTALDGGAGRTRSPW
jgi:hypothetical protein